MVKKENTDYRYVNDLRRLAYSQGKLVRISMRSSNVVDLPVQRL